MCPRREVFDVSATCDWRKYIQYTLIFNSFERRGFLPSEAQEGGNLLSLYLGATIIRVSLTGHLMIIATQLLSVLDLITVHRHCIAGVCHLTTSSRSTAHEDLEVYVNKLFSKR